jgi:hypothetical protein
MSWSATVYRLESLTSMAPMPRLERDHDHHPEVAKTAQPPTASRSPRSKLVPFQAAP